MPAFVVGLVSLGEWLVYDLAPGLLPALLLLLVIALMFLVLVGMFLAPLLFVLQSLVLLFKFLLSMRSSTSWSDRNRSRLFLEGALFTNRCVKDYRMSASKLGEHLQHTVGTCVSGWIK